MPVYEYECQQHGVFSKLVSISSRNDTVECPECGECLTRIISAPRLALMNASNRTAWERNEKSAHEPMRARKHQCGHHCSHHHAHDHSNKPEIKSARNNTRPWMLGH